MSVDLDLYFIFNLFSFLGLNRKTSNQTQGTAPKGCTYFIIFISFYFSLFIQIHPLSPPKLQFLVSLVVYSITPYVLL